MTDEFAHRGRTTRLQADSSRGWRRVSCTVAFLAATAVCLTAQAQVHLQVIIDSSATTARKLRDQNSRLTGTRDVMTTLVALLPADSAKIHVTLRSLGGHTNLTDDAACADTRVLYRGSGEDRDVAIDALRNLEARGRTPLALAMEQAWSDFPSDATTRSMILLTDSWDTCNGDVEGLVERMQESESELALHVIGIGLPSVVAGRLSALFDTSVANSTAEIAAQVAKILAAHSAFEPVEQKTTLRLTRDAQAVAGAEIEVRSALGGHVVAHDPSLDPGQYMLRSGVYSARWRLGEELLEIAGIIVRDDRDNDFRFDIPDSETPRITVVSEEITAASSTRFAVSALPAGNTWLTVVPSDAAAHERLSWATVDAPGAEVDLVLPAAAGLYECRLHLDLGSGASAILARIPVAAMPAETWLAAPDDAEIMAGISTVWTGPGTKGDLIVLVAADAQVEDPGLWFEMPAPHPIDLFTPAEPCDYEIRYLSAVGLAVLDRVNLPITKPEAELRGPRRVRIKEAFDVQWIGPDALNDFVTVVAEDAPDDEYLIWAFTSSGNPVHLSAPTETGAYELRYVSGEDDRVLDRVALKVTGIAVSLDAPAQVDAGTRFELHFTGPDLNGDFIALARPGAPANKYADFSFTSLGSPQSMAAPFRPGKYQLRYISGATGEILARRPLVVR